MAKRYIFTVILLNTYILDILLKINIYLSNPVIGGCHQCVKTGGEPKTEN